jgi:hypothetical protein
MAIQMNNSHREEATRITFNNLQIIGQIVQVEWEEEERNWVIGYWSTEGQGLEVGGRKGIWNREMKSP